MIKNINYYFDDEDYDVFELSRQGLNTSAEREARENVRLKLLELNKLLLSDITNAGMDLHNHPDSIKNPRLITSLTMPCEFNKGKVNWLGVRYGKSKQHLDLLNYGINYKDKNDKLGFQKYACMQVDVCYSGVDVGIYHAVPNDALDRGYLQDKIDEIAPEIIKQLQTIRFKGYKWNVYDPVENKLNVFDFDERPLEEFIPWYKEYDGNGKYSSMLKHFPRLDERISVDNIEDTCFDILSELYDLYRVLSWQPKIS